jgi:hypothetical protein
MKGTYECSMSGRTDLGKMRSHKLRFLFCIGDQLHSNGEVEMAVHKSCECKSHIRIFKVMSKYNKSSICLEVELNSNDFLVE